MKNSLVQRNFFFSEVLKTYLKNKDNSWSRDVLSKPLEYLVTEDGILIDSETISFKELTLGQPKELQEGIQKRLESWLHQESVWRKKAWAIFGEYADITECDYKKSMFENQISVCFGECIIFSGYELGGCGEKDALEVELPLEALYNPEWLEDVERKHLKKKIVNLESGIRYLEKQKLERKKSLSEARKRLNKLSGQ